MVNPLGMGPTPILLSCSLVNMSSGSLFYVFHLMLASMDMQPHSCLCHESNYDWNDFEQEFCNQLLKILAGYLILEF